MRFGIEVEIVRDEAQGFFFRQFLDHRMASGDNPYLARIGKARPHVAIFSRHLSQRAGNIQLRDCRRGLPDARRVLGGEQAQLLEDLALQREHLVFSVQNFAFQFLQLRRGEALGVHQRLLTLVIRRRVMQIRFRDLDVVAEHIVEANLQRLDARPRALAQFDLRDVLAAVAADVAQLI